MQLPTSFYLRLTLFACKFEP